jgi:hypothetical protein
MYVSMSCEVWAHSFTLQLGVDWIICHINRIEALFLYDCKKCSVSFFLWLDFPQLIINSRFEKHTPGLETPFRFELQSIPGEWLTVNASNEVHLQHDSQFPQSLVAAMNCLVHCKFSYSSSSSSSSSFCHVTYIVVFCLTVCSNFLFQGLRLCQMKS